MAPKLGQEHNGAKAANAAKAGAGGGAGGEPSGAGTPASKQHVSAILLPFSIEICGVEVVETGRCHSRCFDNVCSNATYHTHTYITHITTILVNIIVLSARRVPEVCLIESGTRTHTHHSHHDQPCEYYRSVSSTKCACCVPVRNGIAENRFPVFRRENIIFAREKENKCSHSERFSCARALSSSIHQF